MIAIKLFLKELRSNKRYWSFFTVNLCIGLLGFTFIYLFRANINTTLELRAKSLLTADIAVSGRRALSKIENQQIKNILGNSIESHTRTRELYSMAKSASRSRLIFIKAIKGIYPLFGSIELENNGILTPELIQKLQQEPFVVISPEVAYQFRLKIGDALRIGEQSFEVFDILKMDTTSSLRGVNLAPKVYIGDEFLDNTKLVSFGTLAFYTNFFKLDPLIDASELKSTLQKEISDPAINVKTPENSSEQLGRIVNYITNYLGLIGVVALLLSSIGGSYLFQSYLIDRITQIGILRSLGVSKTQIMVSFLILIVVLGGIATALALVMSSYLLPFVLSFFSEYLNFKIQTSLNIEIILITISIGIFVNLLVCYPILFRVFKSKVSMLLANKIDNRISYIDWLLYLPAFAFLWGVSVWQANSFIVGSLFFCSIFIVFLFVILVVPRILKISSNYLKARSLSKPFSLPFGFGARTVSRNTTTTLLTILCLSVGTCLVNVIGQLDHTLKQELGGDTSNKPSLFLFDIQDEQIKELEEFAVNSAIPLLPPSPMVRARLTKKNGKPVKRMVQDDGFETNESTRRRRFNNRGVNLTYAKGINSSETIVEGSEFKINRKEGALPQISLEKRYADRLEVKLGDTLSYEILGIEIQGEVVNIRTVKWTSFLPNFFIKFEPGVLDDAPKTYLSAVKHVNMERQLEVQDSIVDKFSNISIINVTDLISKMINLFSIMAIAIGVMSLCCIGVGIFVLYSILQSQMHKKSNEFALQKIIGMERSQIFGALLWEYIIIVVTSLMIGSLFGILVSRVVSFMFFDGNFSIDIKFILYFSLGILSISLTVVAITFKAFYKKKVNQLLD